MKNILYVVFVLFLVSCYQMEKPKKPDNLIAKDKMINILIDMSILNSAKGINKKILEKKGIDLQQHVFDKYKIDSTQFASSNYYYTYEIDTYKDIYTKVNDSLKKLKEKYTAIEIIESNQKKERDSIARAARKSSNKGLKVLIEPEEPATFGE